MRPTALELLNGAARRILFMKNGWRTRSLKALGVSLVMATAMSMSACNPGGGGPYMQPWYDVYGYQCGSGTPGAGCNFYWDGSKIVDYEDPYYNANNLVQFGAWNYYDSYGYYQTYYGWGWLSPTGILYDDYGYALNNDAEEDGRDLIGDVASLEKQVVTNAGKRLAERFSSMSTPLSEAAGIKIAQTLNDWATLSKKQKRARTDQDIADFSNRLYGVSLDKAKAALDTAKTGDLKGLESVNTDVATYWGTSPETSKAILKGWYEKQLSDVGVK
jgi:hypothetical protein